MNGFTICNLRFTRRNTELRFGAAITTPREPQPERAIFAASITEVMGLLAFNSTSPNTPALKRHKCRAPLPSSGNRLADARAA